MEKDDKGYWRKIVEGISPGVLYLYRLEEKIYRPDPASYLQPEGVHGPSQLVDHKSFNWKGEPPDPQGLETFLMSKLNWEKRKEGNHGILHDFYKNLIGLRKSAPALLSLDRNSIEVWGFEKERLIFMRRWKDGSHILSIFNFNRSEIKG
jgi:1,4-alpha-glucan branching enzyme